MITDYYKVAKAELEADFDYYKIANKKEQEAIRHTTAYHLLLNRVEEISDSEEKERLDKEAWDYFHKSFRAREEASEYLEKARVKDLTKELVAEMSPIRRDDLERVIFKLKLQGVEFDEAYLRFLHGIYNYGDS